ncbi:MAG: hypothetical protein ACK5EU_11210 [Pseudanabaena sp.]
MKKIEAINLLVNNGWAKADAERALVDLDFSQAPDEFTVYKYSSLFAGKELINRQRAQAAQKGMVTRKTKEIDLKTAENTDLQNKAQVLDSQNSKLSKTNEKLLQVKDQLEQDNRRLKNLVDAIRLRITIDGGKLLQYEDSEIRKALSKWFKGMQG